MAEPKTRPTDVDPKAHLAAIVDDRHRTEALRLLDMFSDITGEKAVMWGPSIIGFGQYTAGEGKSAYIWPRIGFAAPKGKFTLYLRDGTPSLDAVLARLGKYKFSVACIYINRLGDIDETVLREAITHSYTAQKARYVS